MTILCVTPNPAIDRTLIVHNFAKGGVFRPRQYQYDAGGKGINTARVVALLGGQAICAGFLGGYSGQHLAKMLETSGIQSHWTWLDDRETRTCVILIDPVSGLTTVINEPGPQLTEDDYYNLTS